MASLTDVKGPTSAIVEYAKIIRDTSKRRRLISVSEYIESSVTALKAEALKKSTTKLRVLYLSFLRRLQV